MNRTAWVIKVLDEAYDKRITSENRIWLEDNIETLDIVVCVEDSIADVFQIAEEWAKDGSFVIQNGKRINYRADFKPTKEALLLVKREEHYYVFLYSPE